MGLFKTTRKKFNSLWFLHHYDVKFLNFTFYEGRKHKRKIFIFFSPELQYDPEQIKSRKICLH